MVLVILSGWSKCFGSAAVKSTSKNKLFTDGRMVSYTKSYLRLSEGINELSIHLSEICLVSNEI